MRGGSSARLLVTGVGAYFREASEEPDITSYSLKLDVRDDNSEGLATWRDVTLEIVHAQAGRPGRLRQSKPVG